MANLHPGDQLAQDVLDWIETTSDHLAQQLLGGALAPATAEVSEAEKLRLFANQFFTPEGGPNDQGRAKLMAKYGPQGFAQIAQALSKRYGQLHEQATGAPPPEPAVAAPPAHADGDWIGALHALAGRPAQAPVQSPAAAPLANPSMVQPAS